MVKIKKIMHKKNEVTIICSDVEEAMKMLLQAGENFDCIFADPDYNVGIKYSGKKYNLKFNLYVDWMVRWSRLAYLLLKDTGNFYVINYPKNNSYLRVEYLDKVFYEVLDYSWVYNSNIGHSPKNFTRAHRSILHCKKIKNNNFYKENVAEPYQNQNDKRIQKLIAAGKGRMPYSWFYVDMVKNVAKDKTSHPCQIPLEVSRKLISASTKPGDKVLVLFSGSGNDVISALKLGNNVTAIDINQNYCDLLEKRILDL